MAQNIIVVGGGVIGSSTAYYLSQRHNVKVKVIEAVAPAASASGKSGGFLALDWCDNNALGPLARKSFALHADLAETLGEDCGYRRVKTHSLAVKAGSGGKASRPVAGLPGWVDTTNISQASVIGTEENTAQVNPELFTKALLREVEHKGGEIILGSVTSINLNPDTNAVLSVSLTEKSTGQSKTITADIVVLALGVWSTYWNQLFNTNTTESDSNISLLPDVISGLKVHSIVVEDSIDQPTTADALFLAYKGPKDDSWDQPLETEVYPRSDGTVYCCGVSSEEAPPVAADCVEVDGGAVGTLKDVVASVSQGLGKQKVLKEQACFLPCSQDGLPLIGAVEEVPGGILNAPATGLGLAELIVDGKATFVDLSAFDPGRFL